MNNFIISNNDYKDIKKIAEKNNLTMNELSNVILNENQKKISHRFHLKLSDEELKIIDNMANKYNLSRSKFIQNKFIKYYSNDLISKIKFDNYLSLKYNKNRKAVNIIFTESNYYYKLKEISKKLSIPYTTILRYILLDNIDED